MRPLFALLTDFGTADPYVAQLKGVLLGLCPEALCVDVSHAVRPHDILHAQFFLRSCPAFFPAGSIFLAIVDPGVGTERNILCARSQGQYFLAPDNGLLHILGKEATQWWRIAHQDFLASATFHGRDIFAPLAAKLAYGIAPEELGNAFVMPVDSDPVPQLLALGSWYKVLHIDRFGNCVLYAGLGSGEKIPETFLLNAVFPVRRVTTYAELRPGETGLLFGSQGFFELAQNQRSCAESLGIQAGERIHLSACF